MSARPNRHVRAAAIPAAQIHDAVVECRRWDWKLVRAADMPQKRAGLRIVRVDALARVHDELRAGGGLDDERRRVRRPALAAIGFPPLLAGAFVDGEQVRSGRVIAEQNEQILIERRRTGVSPIDVERRDLRAEVTRPHEPPVHVERDELARAEPGEHRLPIGDRAGTGEIVFLVHAGQRPHRLHTVLPQPAPVGAMKRLDDEDGAIGGGR